MAMFKDGQCKPGDRVNCDCQETMDKLAQRSAICVYCGKTAPSSALLRDFRMCKFCSSDSYNCGCRDAHE